MVTLQTIDGIYRNLLDTNDSDNINRNITNGFFLIFRNILIVSAISLVIFHFKPIPHFRLIILLSVSHILWNLWQQIVRGLKKNFDFAMGGLIFTITMLLSNIILLKSLEMKVEGILISGILSALITIVYLELRTGIIRHIQLTQLDPVLQKSIIAYSLPLLPTAINWWLLSFANRYYINLTLGSDANGLFAVASRFAAILVMVNNIFYLAWQESAITEYNSKDRNKFYTRMFDAYMRIQLSVVLLLLPITPLVFNIIIDSKFAVAWQYIPFLYIGTAFSAFSTFYGTGYLSSRETRGAFTTTLAGSLVNLLLMFLLVPAWGLQAVGFSSMVSLVFLWIIRLFQTRKYFYIQINFPILILLTICLVIFTFGYYFDSFHLRLVFFVTAILITAGINREFINKILQLINQKLQSLKKNL